MHRVSRKPREKKEKTKRQGMKSLFPEWDARQYFKPVSKALYSKKPPKEKAKAIALQVIGMRREILELRNKMNIEANKVDVLLREAWRVWGVRESKSFTTAQANAFLNIVRDFISNLPE